MTTLGEMRIGLRVVDNASRDIAIVIVTMEQIELGQHARDRVEERPFVEWGIIDIGGEA